MKEWRKEATRKGFEQGCQEGRQEGREKGREEGRQAVARNLIANTAMTDNEIAEMTGLTREQVESLRDTQ